MKEIIHRINSTKDCSFLQYEPIEVTSNKNVILAAVKIDGLALQYASNELKQDKDIIIASLKQNPNVVKYIPPSEILKIMIKGDSDSIIRFAIQGKLIDVPFKVSRHNISVYSPTYNDDKCIDIVLQYNVIELNDYYYSTSQTFCPPMSHDTFFTILDALSFIYQYNIVLVDASTKLTANLPYIRDVDVKIRRKCNLLKDIYALAYGSIERGRRKGYDGWSGTFYDQYGFKNDKYSELIQLYQRTLLIDYDTELYTELNNINDYNKLGLNMDTMTIQDCAKFIIYLCKNEKKMKEMYISFINKFNATLEHRIFSEESDVTNEYIKPVSKTRYNIELIDDMVFNITTLSGGKKSRKKKRGTKKFLN
jgi:hypothetical protein